MPAWTFRQAKSLDLCDLQRTETEQVVSYPLKAQKCLSIVPRGTEKAGKKSLTSYPLFVATCLPAVKLVCFQTFLIGGWQMAAVSFCSVSVSAGSGWGRGAESSAGACAAADSVSPSDKAVWTFSAAAENGVVVVSMAASSNRLTHFKPLLCVCFIGCAVPFFGRYGKYIQILPYFMSFVNKYLCQNRFQFYYYCILDQNASVGRQLKIPRFRLS